MLLLQKTQLPTVYTYLYSSVIFIVLANLCVRVHFLPALVVSLLISCVITWGTWSINQGDAQAMTVFALVYLPVLFFSLFISWEATLSGRRSFLLSLLDDMNRQALVRANTRLQALADTDGLTGIANRRQFDEQAQRFWVNAQQGGPVFALLIVDIDYFKAYNDNYGHPAGDACLTQVAQVLATQLREGEYLATRYGGEEFAILLSPARADQVKALAQRLLQSVRQLAILHAHRPDVLQVVTISIGGALSNQPDIYSLSDLIHCSDARLYDAKNSGRNRVCMES
jgi:diguanylate cyclase (GGDEF)-like protein